MHDVFLSFTRTGHPELARTIRELLRTAGISVFMDEDVPVGEGISPRIADGLNESRIMLVVYSASYNERWACQWELIHACLAGAAEGSAGRRILVVNPEPGDGHIIQVDAADSRFLRPGQLGELVAYVRRKLAQVPGPMGAVRQLAPARWLPPDIPGAFGFTGRFADLWAVHNALSSVDKPLTKASFSGPAAIVTGMPGIGKTFLVRAYGLLFGDSYPGGVFYVSVSGLGGLSAARGRFVDEVRRIAGYLGLPTAGEGPERVIGLMAEQLARAAQPSLWIVDDLPPEVGGPALGQFVIPTPAARMVFTARSGADGVSEIRLGGLSEVDGLAVLRSRRTLAPADLGPARSVVSRLGGHPLALTIAAGYLRDHAGLVSCADYDQDLARDGPDADVLAMIGRAMRQLTAADRTIITLASLLGPGSLSAALIRAVLAATWPPPPAAPATAGALRRLSRGGFAISDGPAWRIHPLVVQASALLGPPPIPAAAIAAAAARELARLLADSADDPVLAANARALADSADLTNPSLAQQLARLVAQNSQRAGNIAEAAARWHQVAESEPHSAADKVAAALACVANGEFGRATGHAQAALSAGLSGDLEILARWALAAGLDGLGRFAAADDLWAGLAGAEWDPEPAQRIAFNVARARAMLARGCLAEAGSILDGVLDAAGPPDPDQLNAARIEQARLLLWTSRERRAGRWRPWSWPTTGNGKRLDTPSAWPPSWCGRKRRSRWPCSRSARTPAGGPKPRNCWPGWPRTTPVRPARTASTAWP